ncbi:MAG TPA: apolipoprotein N-acyltransferase [Acidimicrobiales bacterium]|nr:apolipoprotein N-acyltransferase [Acidimicrobiales bacterium]
MLNRVRARTVAHAASAGLAIAAALPPWGWWPLAFVGLALFDRLIADQPARTRFKRGWLAAAFWLTPGMLWMWDLTPPGYLIAAAFSSALFGAAAAVAPAGAGRHLALPGAFVLAELFRWRWPFGGVPLATLPMTQASSPLAPFVRTLGALLLVAIVVAIGAALSALSQRQWRDAAVVAAVVAVCGLWAAIAPSGYVLRSIEVALVQGGGPQRTRADITENPIVLQRHLDATALIDGRVDLVLWPENVVNPESVPDSNRPRDPQLLYEDDARAIIERVARDLDAVFLPGWFTHLDDRYNDNFTEAIDDTGTVVDTYHKVRIVPFGEYVPLRGLVEPFAGDALPRREVLRGTDPPVLDTPIGRLGIGISWEIFFEDRAREAIREGGQILLNPTNGSSYWLTIVQTQQIASSQLRALETGRWVLQAAPTGFTAMVTPSGRVIGRTGVSEQQVVQGPVELRGGKTLAVRVGNWPMILIAFGLIAGAHVLRRRAAPSPDHR